VIIEETGKHVPLFAGTGVLRYSRPPEYGFRLVMECDQAIADYYRALIPKYKKPAPQRYGAHVSVVRKEIPDLAAWGRYEGEPIEYIYTGTVYFGRVYCWLNVFCTRLEEVRRELGLPVASEYTLPPEGFTKCFHMTIGNFKEL
jgi:hypothetical protein